MARQWRIEYPGAIYHVLSRGNGRQNIVLSDRDRHLFLDILKEVYQRYDISVCAYVLMDNHYHLLVQTRRANLSKAMQWFGTAYTRRFHTHNRTSGHLFQGRFKSIIVENETYLLRLSCYIHRNPLRAGIVNRLADYPWSSYPFYAYRKKQPSWLTTDLILSRITAKDRPSAYRRKVQTYSDEKGNIWEDVKHGLVYGSQDFLDQLKEKFLNDHKDAELPQHNRLLQSSNPEKLAAQAARAFGLDLSSICNTRRIAVHEKKQRDMLIYFLWETGQLSNQRIAELVGLTYSSISRRVSLFRENLDKDNNLKLRYVELKSQIKV